MQLTWAELQCCLAFCHVCRLHDVQCGVVLAPVGGIRAEVDVHGRVACGRPACKSTWQSVMVKFNQVLEIIDATFEAVRIMLLGLAIHLE